MLTGCNDAGESPVVPPPEPTDDFQATLCPEGIIRSLALGAPGHMYAETPQGVLGSTDNGASWHWSFASPTAGTVAADAHGHVYASGITGVYYSSDHGSVWRFSQAGLSDSTGGVSPGPLAVVSDGTVLLGTLASGVYRSSDHGASWSPTSLSQRDVRSLLVTPGGEIIAGCSDYQAVIFRSTDAGSTWTEGSSLSNQIIYTLASDSLANLYAGGIRYLYRSTDTGSTWTIIASTTSRIISVATNSRLHIFAVIAGGGLFGSSDSGSTWQAMSSGLRGAAPRSLVVDAQGFLFVGTDGNGIFRSVRPSNE
jgi:hypothetical protein